MPDPGRGARTAALALLGVSEQATAEQVTHAYRRLAKSTHPDVTGPLDRDAASRFASLTAAYRLLLGASAAPPPPPSPSRPETKPPPAPVPVPIRFTRPVISAGPARISPLPPRSRRSR